MRVRERPVPRLVFWVPLLVACLAVVVLRFALRGGLASGRHLSVPVLEEGRGAEGAEPDLVVTLVGVDRVEVAGRVWRTGRFLRAWREQGRRPGVVALRAGRDAPFAAVFDLMTAFRDSGWRVGEITHAPALSDDENP